MLLADKCDLQEQLKRSLVVIEDKELSYFTQNCATLGTQAALVAGFVYSAIVEARDMDDVEEGTQMAWAVSCSISLVLGVMAIVRAMQLSIMAPGLALRGPEGSMTRAVMVLRGEYKTLHLYFYGSLVAMLVSTTVYHYVLFEGHPRLPIPSIVIIALALLYICYDYSSLETKLRLPPDRTRGRPGWNPAFDPRPDSFEASLACVVPKARAAARGVARGAARLPAKGARGVSQGMSRAASSAGPAAFRAGAGGGSRNGETHHSQGAPQQPRGRDRRADPSERSAHFLNTEGDRGGPSRRDSVTSGCVECSQGASSRPPPEPERPPSLLERARKLFDNLYYHDGGVPGGLPSG